MPTSVRLRPGGAFQQRVEQCAITQSSIAKRVGLSPSRLSQLVSQPRATVSLEIAAAIEDALDVRRGTLFTLDVSFDAATMTPYLTDPPH